MEELFIEEVWAVCHLESSVGLRMCDNKGSKAGMPEKVHVIGWHSRKIERIVSLIVL